MKSFMCQSLGCKVNFYESDAIANMLEDRGYVYDEKNPDLIIVNTCSVTATSDAKSRQKVRHLVKEHPQAIVCVMGCYSQMNYKEASEIEGVGVVIGTKYRDQILDFALEYEKTGKKIIKVDDYTKENKYENLTVYNFYDNTRAYLKIQDGCNHFCTYCIIPYTRGRVRSKDPKLVLKEAQILVDKGYQEIVLTGIHTGGYGQDFSDYTFYDLLNDLVNNVRGLKRLRISSIEINELTDEVLDLISRNKIIVNHLHVPIQSGCNETLKRMNRKYTLDEYIKRIERIRSKIEDVSLTTDVIVGFPGESEEEFEITYNTLKSIGYSRLHVFPFSSREGTVASNMKNHIDGATKKKRVNRLLELSKTMEKDYFLKHLNQVVEVLFEEEKDGYYKGYTTNYLRVRVKSNEDLHGKFRNVRLKELVNNKLDYEIVGELDD